MKISYLLALGMTAATSVACAQTISTNALQTQAPKHPIASYPQIPLSFEVNQGQADPGVRFLSHGRGYSLSLTDSEAILALTRPAAAVNKKGQPSLPAAKNPTPRTDVVHMRFVGASANPRLDATGPLPGKVNYYLGSDPSKWHSNVPTYANLRYTGIYPGVDMVYYGDQGKLEYDFVVAPGADAKPVRLQFDGADKLELKANGDMNVFATHGVVNFHKPVVYQMQDGRRQPVDGNFEMVANNTVGFRLGTYDRSRELVIDPTILYSTYLGPGTGGVIAEDAAGNLYLATGPFGGPSNISKVSTSAPGYSTYFSAEVGAIAVDGSGNAYLTGTASQPDFPATAGAYQTTNSTNGKSFVTKLDSAGAIVYSTLLGGSGNTFGNGDDGRAIAVDSSGYAFVAGATYSTNFPTTAGAYQTTAPPYTADDDAGFLTKMNQDGTGLVYSTYFVGDPYSLAIDSSDNAYLGGHATNSLGFTATPGAFDTTGAYPNFAMKFNPSGSARIYSTYFPGLKNAIDPSGNVYGVGGSGPGYGGWVGKLNASGTKLVYSTNVSGGVFGSIAVDPEGHAFVDGWSQGGLPITANAFQSTFNGFQYPDFNWPSNAAIAELSADGSTILYATYLGGSGTLIYYDDTPSAVGDVASSIAVNSGDNIYISGITYSSNFPITPGEPANPYTNPFGLSTAVGFIAGFSLGPLQAATELVNFPNIALGSSEVEPVTVTNTGASTLTFTTAINAPNYKVVSNSGNTCSAGIPAGQSCTLQVEFDPAGAGQHTNWLTLTSNLGGLQVVSLRGLAAGVGPRYEGSMKFGSVHLGLTNTLPLIIENFGVPGSPTVTASIRGTGYKLEPGSSCSTTGVAAGQICVFNITFDPIELGPDYTPITITPSTGVASSIYLEGIGTPQ